MFGATVSVAGGGAFGLAPWPYASGGAETHTAATNAAIDLIGSSLGTLW